MGKVKEDKKIVGVQLPDFLKEKVEKEAEELCISTSAMIRLIIAQRYRDKKDLEEEVK